MARRVDEFYGDSIPPLPIGVRPVGDDAADGSLMADEASARVAVPEPLRGEVWDVRFPAFGEQPAVVLSVNPLNVRPGHVAVIPITGTPGPASTHLTLIADAGLTGHDGIYGTVAPA